MNSPKLFAKGYNTKSSMTPDRCKVFYVSSVSVRWTNSTSHGYEISYRRLNSKTIYLLPRSEVAISHKIRKLKD